MEYPTEKKPIVSYFEESGDDLKYQYCSFLNRAKKSIFLASFGMTDPDVNKILEEKEKSGVKITYHNSPKEKKLRKKTSGLYHKKILIVDEKELYIGSANCSISSLSLHGNQIFGFSDKLLIQSILANKSLVRENLEFYSLPEDRKAAFERLVTVLQKAKKSISISMYALTHKVIINEIISAYNRGVVVKLYLDDAMVKGTIEKQIKILKSAGISMFVRAKPGTNHHKCALVDNTYIFGSINWSEAGFKKNEETLVIINLTDKKLKKEIGRFFKNLDFYSILL